MRISRRGQVDPFIVMDVVEAARALEEAGRSIIHMEVGQPGTAAPAGARAALAAHGVGNAEVVAVGKVPTETLTRIAKSLTLE